MTHPRNGTQVVSHFSNRLPFQVGEVRRISKPLASDAEHQLARGNLASEVDVARRRQGDRTFLSAVGPEDLETRRRDALHEGDPAVRQERRPAALGTRFAEGRQQFAALAVEELDGARHAALREDPGSVGVRERPLDRFQAGDPSERRQSSVDDVKIVEVVEASPAR